MAEWQHNLAGHVAGPGAMNSAVVQRHHETAFPGGFATCGRVQWRSEKLYAEGEPDVDTALEDLAVAALPDGVTVVGLQFGGLLGGAVLTETVFAWPGVGRMLVDAIRTRDMPLVQGTVLFIAVVFILVNLVVDLSYAALNPKVRYE